MTHQNDPHDLPGRLALLRGRLAARWPWVRGLTITIGTPSRPWTSLQEERGLFYAQLEGEVDGARWDPVFLVEGSDDEIVTCLCSAVLEHFGRPSLPEIRLTEDTAVVLGEHFCGPKEKT